MCGEYSSTTCGTRGAGIDPRAANGPCWSMKAGWARRISRNNSVGLESSQAERMHADVDALATNNGTRYTQQCPRRPIEL